MNYYPIPSIEYLKYKLMSNFFKKTKRASEELAFDEAVKKDIRLTEAILGEKISEIKPLKTEQYLIGYEESIKAELNNAIELQEQEEREEYNRGREDAFKYALEMMEKHKRWKQLNDHTNC